LDLENKDGETSESVEGEGAGRAFSIIFPNN